MYKKILSIALSLCMILSVTSGALTAFAYTGDKATGKKTATNVTVVNEDKTVTQSDESIVSLKYYSNTDAQKASNSLKTLLGLPEGTDNLASADKMTCLFHKSADLSYTKSADWQSSNLDCLFDDYISQKADNSADICKGNANSPMQYKDADGNFNPITDGSVTLNMIYDLKDVYDISEFALSFNFQFHAGRYEVYTSKEIGQLFNSKPLVDSTSTNAGRSNSSFKIDSYKVQENAKVYARYVAFRFYGTTYGDAANADYIYDRLRMDEIGIYGTKVATKGITPTVTTSNTRDIDTEYPSIVQDGTYSWNAPYAPDGNKLTGSGAIPGKLYDNGVKDEFYGETSAAWFAKGTEIMVDDEYHIDFVYEVDSSVNIANIQIAGNTGDGLKTGRYVIYASDDLDTLFNDENIVVDYDNSLLVGKEDALAMGSSTAYQKFAFNNGALKAAYIAVRVYDPCSYIANRSGAFTYPSAEWAQAYYKLRLNELNVYGYTEPSLVSASGKNGKEADYMKDVDITKSLIADKGRVYSRYINTDKGVTTPTSLGISEQTTADSDGNRRNVPLTSSTEVNGNILIGSGVLNFAEFDESGKVTGIINDETRQYAEFAYDLGGLTNVEKVAFYGHPQDLFTPYKYRLSFANSADELFTDNAVYSTGVLTNRNNYVTITATEEIKARYVAMRIICGITPSAIGTGYGTGVYYARMCHFDVFGTPAETTYKVTFASKNGSTVYGEFNVVEGQTLTAEQIDSVAAPELYGYTFKGWDGDVNAAITADTVFTPVFEKTTDTYTVNYTLSDGTNGSETHNFDDRVTLTDANAKAWYNENNTLLAVGTDAVFYVYGDMTVTAKADAEAPTAPVVSIVDTTVTDKAASHDYHIFVHAYTMDKRVEKIGVVFLSKTQYLKLASDNEFTTENLDSKNIKYLDVSGDTYDNFMGTLTGVTTGTQVTRYARAYVVVDGVTYYSNVVSNTFNAQ